jgi:uncharacterized Zn finger protein
MSNRQTIRAGSCPVCGERDVRSDVVEHEGFLLLGECPRCDHRWTQALREEPMLARVPVRAVHLPEVASAA